MVSSGLAKAAAFLLACSLTANGFTSTNKNVSPFARGLVNTVPSDVVTAATTSALRRTTHRVVEGGGKSANVSVLPSGPII